MPDLLKSYCYILSPSGVLFAVVKIAEVKDVVHVIGALVTICCTILVTRHQLRKK